MKKYLLLTLCLFGCQARPNHYETKLMNGDDGYRLDCDVNQLSEEQCNAEAHRLCGNKEIMFWYYKANSRNAFVQCLGK